MERREVRLVTDVLLHLLWGVVGWKWEKKVRNLIMIGNRGQRRHTEWARKGGRFRYELAIARETIAAALEKQSF